METIRQKITPFLWFDKQAEEAANFYTSIFRNSKIESITRYEKEAAAASGMPEGTVMTVAFELEEQAFTALNGGPLFSFTPSVSFSVNCETQEEIDKLWEKLSEGGKVLMPLDKYPFSEKYGWVEDKFGLSWQLSLTGNRMEQKIIPSLLYVGEQHGKAEEAMKFYTSLFKNSDMMYTERYGSGEGETEGTVKYAAFTLNGQAFTAMDSNQAHGFTFTEAISFVVHCENQDEVDRFWEQLSEGGEEGQCGWLKDKYGVSWQIVPNVLSELLQDKDAEKVKRVTEAMLKMKKLDSNVLKQAAKS